MSEHADGATPTKVLIIRNAFVHDFGGGERFPVDLAAELQPHGFAPTIISRSPKLLEYARSRHLPAMRGWWWSQQNWSGWRVVLTPFYILWQILLFGWYFQLIARLKPAVVHPQSRDDFIAASLAARCLGKRVIWTDHADLKYAYQNHGVWYKNPVGKLVFACGRLAAAITLVSQSEAQLVSTALRGRRVDDRQSGKKAVKPALPANYQVIHNGVRDKAVEPYKRPENDRKAFVFCATSRLVGAKGIAELIRAFGTLNQQHPESRLWLVGDGPDAKPLQLLANNNPAITFFGHQHNALGFVAASDVFVHPSYHEGFSLSLVEAAMLGKPIVACDVGGNPEIIINNKTGLLIKPRDPASLERAMRRMYDDHALAQKLGHQARQLYLKDFQFDTIVSESFVPLYKNLRRAEQ